MRKGLCLLLLTGALWARAISALSLGAPWAGLWLRPYSGSSLDRDHVSHVSLGVADRAVPSDWDLPKGWAFSSIVQRAP